MVGTGILASVEKKYALLQKSDLKVLRSIMRFGTCTTRRPALVV
jgi:hypothetical protein